MLRSRAGTAPVESPEPVREGSGRIIHAIGILGRVLVVAGLLLLYFTVYLLWGTTTQTKQHQRDLAQELETMPMPASVEPETGEIPPARPSTEPEAGDPLFTLVIPDLDLRSVVVSGVGREELKKGPGHFRDSPYPGETGNVPLSGHRTTYGAPFYRLNELEPGAVLDIESGGFRYRYRMRERRIVAPSAVDVVGDHGTDELTLTTCHPRFSAAQRLIVHADYEGAEPIGGEAPTADTPVAAAPQTSETSDRSDGSDAGTPEGRATHGGSLPDIPSETFLLLGIALAALLGAMFLSKRFRLLSLYLAIVAVGGTGLWLEVFPRLVLLLPANY